MTEHDTYDFLMQEACRLREHAMERSGNHTLDQKTAMWIIREEAWQVIKNYARLFACPSDRPPQLLGLNVRRTIGDPADAPMIQLVMEPMLFDKGKRP